MLGTDRPAADRRLAWVVAAALLYAFLFVVRYRGLWTENDTAFFTRDAVAAVHRHTVLFSGAYPHGFLYTSWLASFDWLAGVPPTVFNTVVAPFVAAVVVVLAAYVGYRAVTGSSQVATLAAWLLLAVPELMFSVLRGNHEKIDIAVLLAVLFALVASVAAPSGRRRSRRERDRQRTWQLVFALLMLMNAATNDYFAALLVLAGLVAAGIMGVVITRLPHPSAELRRLTKRLATGMATGAGIVVLVMLVVYPPAAQDFHLLTTALSKLALLLITLTPHSNPYAAPAAAWAGRFAYLLVASFRWMMFASSLVVFGWASWRMVHRRMAPPRRLLVLALYVALGGLVAVAIPLDFTGLAAGSNLEVRNFTYFALLAAPLTALGIRRVAASEWVVAQRRWLLASAGALVSVLMVVGIVKVTLDPLLSNEWIFYTPAERQAVGFFLAHAHDQALWTGPDNRLVYMADSLFWKNPGHDLVTGFKPLPFTRDFLWSPEVVADSEAQRFPLPAYQSADLVYDNGGAAIYQLVPKSALQTLPP